MQIGNYPRVGVHVEKSAQLINADFSTPVLIKNAENFISIVSTILKIQNFHIGY